MAALLAACLFAPSCSATDDVSETPDVAAETGGGSEDALADTGEVAAVSDTESPDAAPDSSAANGDGDADADDTTAEDAATDGDTDAGGRDATPNVPSPFRVEPVQVPGLHRDEIIWREGDETEGFGVTLIDFDGDNDDDVFVSNPYEYGPPPCLYRNVSRPGRLRFEQVAPLCDGTIGPLPAASAVDLNLDGVPELVGASDGELVIITFGSSISRSTVDLAVHFGADVDCAPGVVHPDDVNLDGLPDLYIACQPGLERSSRRGRLLLLTQTSAGWSADEPPFTLPAVPLALASFDLNRDGLFDLVVANDAFATRLDEALPGQGGVLLNPTLHPGGAFMRCEPDASCVFEEHRFGESWGAYGAFMGIGLLATGTNEVLIVTDWGPNRAVAVTDGGLEALDAAALGVAYGVGDQAPLVNWSALVHDYNRDGLDDVLLTQGHIGRFSGEHDSHRPHLLTQQVDGTFGPPAEAGLESLMTPPVDSRFTTAAPRGAILADLDHDGRAELLFGALEGRPAVFQEVGQADTPPRCTLVPHARYAPRFGSGYEIIDDGGQRHHYQPQGQFRMGASASILSPLQQGTLRFPSGFVARFDCAGGAGPVAIEEPPWFVGPPAWIDDSLWLSTATIESVAEPAGDDVRVGEVQEASEDGP